MKNFMMITLSTIFVSSVGFAEQIMMQPESQATIQDQPTQNVNADSYAENKRIVHERNAIERYQSFDMKYF